MLIELYNKYKNTLLYLLIIATVLAVVGLLIWGMKGILLALLSGFAAPTGNLQDDPEVKKAEGRMDVIDKLAKSEFDKKTSEREAEKTFKKETKDDMEEEASEIDRESRRL